MTRKEFIKVWKRDWVGQCFYCGCKLRSYSQDKWDPFAKTRDHVLPRNRHREMNYNIVDACAGCNCAKGDGSIDLFREWWGEPFYCEIVIGERFPKDISMSGNGGTSWGYGAYLDCIWNKKILSPWLAKLDGKRLKIKLNLIILQAQQKGGIACQNKMGSSLVPVPTAEKRK